jgi:alanyl-tRNA synthetase
MDELRTLAQAVVALPQVLLVGAVAEPPSLMVASSEDAGLDAGKTLRDVVTRLGGRGGGSPRIAQGTVPDAGRLAEAVASILATGR